MADLPEELGATPPPVAGAGMSWSEDVAHLTQALVDQEGLLDEAVWLLRQLLDEDGAAVPIDERLAEFWRRLEKLGDWKTRDLVCQSQAATIAEQAGEIERLRHYADTCGGSNNDGRCPLKHLLTEAIAPLHTKVGEPGQEKANDP